ncbi:receptor kinase-like protein Xa21 [Rhodamnia argentea]|uniref:Receptor kinase-like protein Xa21 n=1 Tax=Rhodamnia argentea TaxID=178133 RepID=A0ABM3HJC7_9MYRT|nr:receptor kinase-like protein Xa21 [Rhodamnia argentea]
MEKLNQLQWISISVNQLGSGVQGDLKFLESINSTSLELLAINLNNFGGTLPESIGNLSSQLNIVSIECNRLSGNIPSSIGNLRGIDLLYIGNNKFTGSVPDTIGNLVKLKELRIQMNKLTGNIASTIGNMTELTELILKGNNFQGSIPPSISECQNLVVLDLSQNNLSGIIPSQGEVPGEGVFLNMSVTSLEGNDKLCGSMPILDLPSCLTSKGKRRSSTSHYVIIAITCGTVAVLILLLLLVTFYWLRRKNSRASLETPSIRGFQQGSYEDIVKATDGFNSSNLIGVGGFGSVYKGTLEDGNKMVAVKVFDLKQRGASKSFIAECKVLKNVRHRNLLKILTACSSVNFQGNEFKALVYEFMENACTVDYLHHQCHTEVIHCDLKPSNILLDAQMNEHVGDFGLARIFPNPTGDLHASQTSSIGLRGTIGYAPPEYGMGSNVSEDGDVYIYGVLQLDALNLHDYCLAALPERAADVADQPLPFYDTEESSIADTMSNQRNISAHVQECLVMIFEIGVARSAELPQERMSISDAVTRLRSLKQKVDKMGFR